MLLIIPTLICAAFLTIYFKLKYHFNYFKRRNVNYVEPTLLLGNLKDLFLPSMDPVQWMNSLYHSKRAKHQPFIGFFAFHKPGIFVRDPELIKHICIKHTESFKIRDTRAVRSEMIRTKLLPIFSSAKVKQMFPLIDKIGNHLNGFLSDLTAAANGTASKEIKEVCDLFTATVMSSVILGVEPNCLQVAKDFKRKHSMNFWKNIYSNLAFFTSEFTKWPSGKNFNEFLENTIKGIIKTREKGNDLTNDFIGILTESERNYNSSISSQIIRLFSSALNSSSTVLSFALHELAKNTEVQTKLRNEIKDVLNENEGLVTYEVVNKCLPYLDNVVQEVLRMYPPVPFIDREVSLPRKDKEYSLEPFGHYNAPNGTPVYIPIASLHKSHKFFPNPNMFDPERFSSENRRNIISGSYLPFGIGPKNCVGEKFVLIMVKIGLINFLKGNIVRTNALSKNAIVFCNNLIHLEAKGGIHLDIIKEV